MIKYELVDVRDLWSTYNYQLQECALKCISVHQCALKNMKKIKMLVKTKQLGLGVDLKSLLLAECQFESGQGHH